MTLSSSAKSAVERGRQGTLAQGDLELLIATIDQLVSRVTQLESEPPKTYKSPDGAFEIV